MKDRLVCMLDELGVTVAKSIEELLPVHTLTHSYTHSHILSHTLTLSYTYSYTHTLSHIHTDTPTDTTTHAFLSLGARRDTHVR
jgi:hypothetical protein